MPRMTTWHLECPECNSKEQVLCWDHELPKPCSTCGHTLHFEATKFDNAPGLVTDDIPGGELVDHLYPTPRRFYSKTDIKRACNELGWTRKGDTPVPYKVQWSGKRKEPEKVKPLIGTPAQD